MKLQTLSSVIFILIEFCHSCPIYCVCKWKNGKQTVECINKDLLVIPDGMDSGTQVLEFSGNNLQTLHREKFLKMDLINLQRIYLARCRITTIDEWAFKGLSNLVELDLSSNLVQVIPGEAFSHCPSLMRLTFSHNPIKALYTAAFKYLSFLSTLELDNCEIATVKEGAFQGLYSLEWLNLNGNKMTSFRGARQLPEGLKGIQLQDNPWECDCFLLELHAWLLTFNYPHSVEPICNGPSRLAGRAIKSVPEKELACLAEVTPTSFYLELEEGKNVSLLCQVHAVPEAKVTWYFQGQILQNDSILAPGVHLLYFVEQGSENKRSELFIYNANTDDNGTFICNAENAAGIAQANFTIRIVVRQEIPNDVNEIPLEFLLLVLGAGLISATLLICVVILSIIKCYHNARLKKSEQNKAAIRNTTKDNLLQESSDDTDHLKECPNLKLEEEEVINYTARPDHLIRCLSPPANQLSPTSLRCYSEQNPDIINGTESIHCKKMLPTIQEFKQDCNLCMLPSDVHLNPVTLLSSTDNRSAPFNGNYYRTLPYNRGKRANAANPVGRFSREAEFLQSSAYEHYECDLRYTADGYPAKTLPNMETNSPPESHKSTSSASTEPCCSSAKTQMSFCVTANTLDNRKKLVGAQTQTDSANPPVVGGKVISSILKKPSVRSVSVEFEGERL